MKKSLRFCVLLALAAVLLTVSAFADTGPKPQLTVKVTNPPEELYYLDLLAEGDWEHAGNADYSGLDWSYSEEEIAALDSGLLDALRAAVPDGWHACTAEGSNGAPMWGDLLGEDAENGARVPTGVLNEMLARATARMQPPSDKGRRLKIYYLTQASTRPPTFVAFVNAKHLFHFSYQRYLINQIRENFGLEHTPIRLVVRERGSGEVGAKDV